MQTKTTRILCGVGAVLGAVLSTLFLVSATALETAYLLVERFVDILTGNAIPINSTWFGSACYFIVLFAPAALCAGCAWLIPEDRKNALKTSALYSGIPIAISLLMILLQGLTGLLGFFGTAIGSFGCIGCILLYGWLTKKLPAVFNRETISYIVFGVLTTVVSFVSQMLFSAAGFPVIVNTIGSWVCAVLFAYVVNKLFVFESKTDSAKAFWRELGLFIGARVASLGMELVFMFVTVELLHFSEAVCKLIAQIFILIANYILSKLIIFKKSA